MNNSKILDIGVKFGGAKKDYYTYLNGVVSINPDIEENKLKDLITLKSLWAKPDFRQDALNGVHAKEHSLLFALVYQNIPNKISANFYNYHGRTLRECVEAYIACVLFYKEQYENHEHLSVKSLDTAHTEILLPLDGTHWSGYSYATSNQKRYHLTAMQYKRRSFNDHFKTILFMGYPNVENLDESFYYSTEVDDDWLLGNNLTHYYCSYIVKANTNYFGSYFSGTVNELKTELLNRLAEIVKAKANKTPKENTRYVYKRPIVSGTQFNNTDARQGRDISSEELMNTFGLKGIEWGNYVPQKERQQYLNNAYDSFHDLMILIKAPLSFASLGGSLGIAFGSRGHGRFAAHYEPSTNVINLTRTKGIGSFAHEWGHALDHYIGKNILKGCFLTDFTNRSILNSSLYREEDYTPKQLALINSLHSFDCLMKSVRYKNDDREYTRFITEAHRLDIKKPYYSTNIELFARVFESWCEDTLYSHDRFNYFLVNGTRRGIAPSVDDVSAYPYPRVEVERESMVNAMDEFIKIVVPLAVDSVHDYSKVA
ncbi:LPD1 domain-containing protein [Acinetobacter sp. P1(2025)]|uniref:LPD1 domain-containing protein n=1 Tax=Acinetobacter sp. P1(2025) TaxID=3446120 RepID=UPI003F539EC0